MTTLRKLTLGTIAALMLASSPAMARPGYHHCYSDAQDAQAHHSSGDNGDELCPDTETSAQKKQEVTFNYSCNLESGKSHLLVNETKNFLLWRGKNTQSRSNQSVENMAGTPLATALLSMSVP